MDDFELMRAALDLARRAMAQGEVPVGAVVASEGRLIGQGHNAREAQRDPTGHAEIVALRDAAGAAGAWRIDGATVAVTMEPCPMCAGALVNARVARVLYGAVDPKAGALGSLYNLGQDPRLNHEFEVVPGVLADECAQLLSDFFSRLRSSGK